MNEERYKETFNAIFPSEEAVERIYELTSDKKKFSFKKIIRRVAAATMALAIAAGIGLGADFIKESNYEPNTNITTDNNSSSNKLGVLVAYADEKKFIEIKNLNEQKLFYRVYVQDYSNKEKTQQIENEFKNEVKKEEEFLYSDNRSKMGGSYKTRRTTIFNPASDDEEVIGLVSTFSAGELALDLNDYSNVKDITFENSSKYGDLDLYYIPDKEVDEDDLPSGEFLLGNRISITGKELQYSLESGRLSSGLDEYEVNKGYRFNWVLAESFYEEIEQDFNFDLTKIKDTINFTVNYLDGTTEYTSVDISFDKDGYMHLSDKSLTK